MALRKITLLLVAGLLSIVARADEPSNEIIDRIATTLGGYGNYEVRFTASASGMDDIQGNYYVSGDRYSITVADQTHFSDGSFRYEVNDAEKEVVIDRVNLSSRNILTNPARAFDFATDEFEGVYRGRITLRDHECDMIRLIPVNTGYGSNMIITLYVSPRSGLPIAIEYDYEGEKVDIVINNIIPLDSMDENRFTFDKKRFGDYDLIDFR